MRYRHLLLIIYKNTLFLSLVGCTRKFGKCKNIVLAFLFSIIITSVGISGNGQMFFLVNATPVQRDNATVIGENLTKQHIILADGFLNVITKVKNLYTFGGIVSNGTYRIPSITPAEGSLTPKDFTVEIVNDDPRPRSFPGKTAEAGRGQIVKLTPGHYSVYPSFTTGYMTDYSPDCQGEIKTKELKECIITHTFVGTATVKVITAVDNTGGGNATVENTEFAFFRCEPTAGNRGVSYVGVPSPGKDISLSPWIIPWSAEPGIYCYKVSPEPLPSYISRADGDCDRDAISVGETGVCTLTYKFVGKATLKVTTMVNNTGGGSAKAEDFIFTVENNGEKSAFGICSDGDPLGKPIELSAGTYHVTTAGCYLPSGYSHRESSGCWGAILTGETKECLLTYNFKSP
jgi:prealbumin domain-containing protein